MSRRIPTVIIIHIIYSRISFANMNNWAMLCHFTDVYRRISKTPASQRLRPVAVTRLAPSHASYRGPELVWATGRLMLPDRGFGTSCLLHCGRMTVSANSEDSWKRYCLLRTRLCGAYILTLAFRRRIQIVYSYLFTSLSPYFFMLYIFWFVDSFVEFCLRSVSVKFV